MNEPLSPDSGKPISPKTADDINDIFNELDKEDAAKPDKGEDEKPVKAGKKPAKDDDDEDEDIKIDSDEDVDEDEEIAIKEPDDEDDERLRLEEDDIEIDAPPRKKEILKEFPEVFKKFPFLEKMMYRDRQYTELFGSFDDAKELAERAEIFTGFEQQLLSGKTEEILKNVKETDPKAFDKIVDTYLITLAKVDKDAYYDVTNSVAKRIIVEMVKEANDSQNEELKQAALLMNQFLYGTSKFVPHAPRTTAEKAGEEQSEAEKERLSLLQERFETAKEDIQTRVDNTLRATISSYIDPKDIMTPYMKKNAVNDALQSLHSTLGRDTSFRKSLDKTWRSAYDAKYSKDSVNRIQSLYLGRAKGSLKAAIQKARVEALKDYTPAPRDKQEDEEPEEKTQAKPEKTRLTPGRPSQGTKKSEMKKGESVAEFFARD